MIYVNSVAFEVIQAWPSACYNKPAVGSQCPEVVSGHSYANDVDFNSHSALRIRFLLYFTGGRGGGGGRKAEVLQKPRARSSGTHADSQRAINMIDAFGRMRRSVIYGLVIAIGTVMVL